MKTIWTKYRVEFAAGSKIFGSYLGDTVEGLHRAIEGDFRLKEYEESHGYVDILKYGYFKEFENGEYESKEYVIDNCMHFIWTVR